MQVRAIPRGTVETVPRHGARLVVVRAETFGERLRRFRRAAGLGQVELADRVNIARSSLDAYERGWHMPPVDTFAALARVLADGDLTRLWEGEP